MAGTAIIVWCALRLTEWVPTLFGKASSLVVGALLLVLYVGTIALSTHYPGEPDTEINPNTMLELPEAKPTVVAGLYI